jgi:hypothetical protein
VIPRAYIHAWSARTPWRASRQVEQDLIIGRALCDIFREPFLADRLAFRGGTAIHKRLLRQPLRYSEDIDLVQRRAEPIGPRSMPCATCCRGSGRSSAGHVWFELVAGLKGERSIKSAAVIKEFRATSLPELLPSTQA